jgi:hypothetical protein
LQRGEDPDECHQAAAEQEAERDAPAEHGTKSVARGKCAPAPRALVLHP